MQQCRHLARPRAAERVPKGYRAPLGVDLLDGNAQFLDAVQRLTGKRLVDLKDIDVIQRQAWTTIMITTISTN